MVFCTKAKIYLSPKQSLFSVYGRNCDVYGKCKRSKYFVLGARRERVLGSNKINGTTSLTQRFIFTGACSGAWRTQRFRTQANVTRHYDATAEALGNKRNSQRRTQFRSQASSVSHDTPDTDKSTQESGFRDGTKSIMSLKTIWMAGKKN